MTRRQLSTSRRVAAMLTITLAAAAGCQRAEGRGTDVAPPDELPAGVAVPLSEGARDHAVAATDGRPVAVTVYKSPSCGCCAAWVEHMQAAGFTVTTVNRDDVAPIKAQYGVSARLASCHTALVDVGEGRQYVVEGHVPAADVRRLLQERPAVLGLAAPGMPGGSPGMEMPGMPPDRYDVVSFAAHGATRVFASH